MYFANKDAVILNGISLPWDWGWQGPRYDPMHHDPGYREIDLDYYIFNNSQGSKFFHLILTTGRE